MTEALKICVCVCSVLTSFYSQFAYVFMYSAITCFYSHFVEQIKKRWVKKSKSPLYLTKHRKVKCKTPLKTRHSIYTSSYEMEKLLILKAYSRPDRDSWD